jgi:hypothetical protein
VFDRAIRAPNRLARRGNRYSDGIVRRERSHFALGFPVRAFNFQVLRHGSKTPRFVQPLFNASCKPLIRYG